MSEIKMNEKDKPFIIAMVLVLAFVALIFMGAIGVIWNNAGIEQYVQQTIGNLGGIVGTVVAFYFGTKIKK